MRTVVARHDPRLRAGILRERPLTHRDGAGRRVAVRAGSSLAWFGQRLAVVQDDADHVALIDPRDAAVATVALPGVAGREDKLDLEACVTMATPAGEVLVMLSSGSRQPPWCIATLRDPLRPVAALHAADEFYAGLRAFTDFTGGVLNLEGALSRDAHLRLLNRGGRGGANASIDVSAAAVLRLLAGGAPPRVPALPGVTQYNLGALDGVALGFTDVVAAQRGGMLYVASAEDSAGAAIDGRVAGSALGVIRRGRARWTGILRTDGSLYPHKVEGICLDPARPGRGWLVTDPDDADAPAMLCEIELSGPW